MTKEYFLANGMKVLVNERHRSPVVSVQVWVQTGSADEKKGQEGISHFIEHLVFKGSKKFKVGEIASTIEGHGGELNAYTTFDRTVFHITISQQFLEVALECLSEMMGFPSFEEVEIDNEREVVIEEIKRSLDSPSHQASQSLFKLFYQDHPYGIPVIGYEENIRTVSHAEISEYYRNRYVPENMTLVIVGDFASEKLQDSVAKYFEPFQKLKLSAVTRKSEPETVGPAIQIKQGTHEETFVHLAWKVPEAKNEDTAALDILSFVLGQGESSRLMKRLRISNPVTNYAVASLFSPKDPGFFVITLSLNKSEIEANLKTALDLLLTELTEILTAEPSAEEMKKAILNTESQEFYSLETVDGLANKYGAYDHLFGDYSYYEKFIEQVTQLTGFDILTTARKYLKPESLVISMVSSQDPNLGETLFKDWTGRFAAVCNKANGEKLANPVVSSRKHSSLKWQEKTAPMEMKKIELATGATLLIRSVRDVPVVNVRAAFLGGLRAEKPAENGITELLSRCWAAGTASLSESALYGEVERRAARLRAFGGRNTVGLSMLALEHVAEEIFQYFSDVLTQPQFSQDINDREKKYLVEEIRMRNDRPAGMAVRGFMENIFGNHPYSRDILGSETSLGAIDVPALETFHQSLAVAKNMVIAVTGDIDVALWTERIEKLVARMTSGNKQSEQFSDLPSELGHVFQQSEKKQSHLVIGYPGLTFKDGSRYTLSLLQAILAGQGGRLFLELRDKASLAYSVSPIRMEGIDAGYFGAYIGCSPEKVDLAKEMLLVEFSKLKDTKISAQELNRAKNYLLGSHDIEMQRSSSLGSAMLFDEIYGIPFDESFRFAEHLDKVTPEKVMDLAQSLFSVTPATSLVGPTNLKGA